MPWKVSSPMSQRHEFAMMMMCPGCLRTCVHELSGLYILSEFPPPPVKSDSYPPSSAPLYSV